jgi:hypothetical protein
MKWLFVCAGFKQEIIEAELLRFGNAPRHHKFAADAILELSFTLSDKDTKALLGEHSCPCGAAQSTANRDCIVIVVRHRHCPVVPAVFGIHRVFR